MTYKFISGSGDNVRGIEAIIPILKQSASGKFRLIGTGFLIAKYGIFVTAKHVLMDVFNQKGEQTEAIGVFQFLGNNQYLIRKIERCSSNSKSDVTVGVLQQVHHKVTGKVLENKIVKLTTSQQPIGSPVITFAYPESQINHSKNKQVINFRPNFYEGNIEEYHPRRRDNVMLPFPCYRSTMRILGGASGGPVFNERGQVFGVNCTGVAGSDKSLSYFVRINEIIPLCIDKARLGNDEKPRRIYISELIELGHVVCD